MIGIGQLFRVGDALFGPKGVIRRFCCCARFSCVDDSPNRCGDMRQICVPDPNGIYGDQFCNGACPDPPPQCCENPCGPCEVCNPNCTKCPQNPLGCCNPQCESVCSECEYCDGDKCVPKCVEGCETCANGSCESVCGECETCWNGTCIPCPDGTECVDGACVPPPPKKYYCCLDEVEPPPPPSEGEPPPPTPPPTASCTYGPCGKIVGGVFVAQPERTIGGPYDTPGDCADSCRPHSCVPDSCGGSSCNPESGGEYLSREKCREAGNCNDVTNSPCGLSPASPACYSGTGAGSSSYFFTIGSAENLPVCVSYASTCGKPIRVQIWAPLLSGDGCTELAERVIVCDSQWRGIESCNCGFDPPGGFKGSPVGVCKWRTKQRYVNNFEVRVLTECADNKWTVCVSCGDCEPMPAVKCCDLCKVKVGDVLVNLDDVEPADALSVTWNGQSVPPGRYLQTFPGFDDDESIWPDWPNRWLSIQVDQTMTTGYERWLAVGQTVYEFPASVDCVPPTLAGRPGSSGGLWVIDEINATTCRISGWIQVVEKWEDADAECGAVGVFHKTCTSIYKWHADVIDQELQAAEVEFVCGAKVELKDGPDGCAAVVTEGECGDAPNVTLAILP